MMGWGKRSVAAGAIPTLPVGCVVIIEGAAMFPEREVKTSTNNLQVEQVRITQAVETFLKHEGISMSAGTIGWYRKQLKCLVEFLGDRDVNSLLETDLIDFYNYLSNKDESYGGITTRPRTKKKLSAYTVRGYLRAAKRFTKWLYEKGIIEPDIGANLKLPKLPKFGRKGISENNIRKILKASKGNVRDYAILRFMEATGCRRGGVANLKISDLGIERDAGESPELRRRVVVREKGNKERVVFLTQRALQALINWLDVRQESLRHEYVFTGRSGDPISPRGISAIVRRYKERLGISGPCSPHQWRHRFCRKRLEEGLDLSRVSQLAGHDDPQITIRYYGGFALDDLQRGYDEHVEDIDV